MANNNTGRQVFTTGQVAKICKVAPRTVSKWFDSGRLKGYRIPGSQDRRIPRRDLLKFLKEHSMPTHMLADHGPQVLLVSDNQHMIRTVEAVANDDAEFTVHVAQNAFEAGSVHAMLNTVIIDFSIGRSEAIGLMRSMRKKTDQNYPQTEYIAIVCEDENDPTLLEVPTLFDVVHKQPFNVAAMVEAMFAEQMV